VQPVAEALNLPIISYDASNTASIMDEIIRAHKGKIVLVVGHSNTVPTMIGNMGASKKVPEIDDNEYDNIYVVSIPWFGKTKTIRLRYGAPYVPAP
jgi:broad specificity phosphatase PhoE